MGVLYNEQVDKQCFINTEEARMTNNLSKSHHEPMFSTKNIFYILYIYLILIHVSLFTLALEFITHESKA